MREVWLQNNLDTNDNDWIHVSNWTLERSTIVVQDKLILNEQYDSGYKLKLIYVIPHPQLYLATDKLSDAIPLGRVVYPALRDCFEHLKQRTRRKDWDSDIRMWNERAEQVRSTRPIYVPRRSGKILAANTRLTSVADYYPGDRNPR